VGRWLALLVTEKQEEQERKWKQQEEENTARAGTIHVGRVVKISN